MIHHNTHVMGSIAFERYVVIMPDRCKDGACVKKLAETAGKKHDADKYAHYCAALECERYVATFMTPFKGFFEPKQCK